jgi:Tol biopolymer transport system component
VSSPVSAHSGRVHWPALLGVAVLAAVCALGLTSPAGARRAPQASAAAPAIAFIRGDHVWKVAPDGTGFKQLTSGKSEDSAPAWSPDHATIAFVRPGSSYKTSSIYTVPAAGGDARLLYKASIAKATFLDVTGLAYSPDGTKLAFAETYSAKGSPPIMARLVILDIESGRTSVMLTKTGGFGHILVTAWYLSWSPDGSAILISQQGQDDEGNGTWVYTIISGATKAIPVRNASRSDWAADGQSVLLSTSTPVKTSIKQAKLDGTVIRTLATGGGWDGPGPVAVLTAQYSPDGSQVVFVKSASLWIMNADGTGKHKVTAGFTPAW